MPHVVAYALVKWVYTDNIDLTSEDTFLLNLLKLARRFNLGPLSDRYDKVLFDVMSPIPHPVIAETLPT